MPPLLERKRRLGALVPRASLSLLYLDSVKLGLDPVSMACERDLEEIVAKRPPERISAMDATSWLKIKNPPESQMEGRRELFDARCDRHSRNVNLC